MKLQHLLTELLSFSPDADVEIEWLETYDDERKSGDMEVTGDVERVYAENGRVIISNIMQDDNSI